jgi:hypothetical protein
VADADVITPILVAMAFRTKDSALKSNIRIPDRPLSPLS